MKKIQKETIKLIDSISEQLFDFGVRDVELSINRKEFIKLKAELGSITLDTVSTISDDGIVFRIKSL